MPRIRPLFSGHKARLASLVSEDVPRDLPLTWKGASRAGRLKTTTELGSFFSPRQFHTPRSTVSGRPSSCSPEMRLSASFAPPSSWSPTQAHGHRHRFPLCQYLGLMPRPVSFLLSKAAKVQILAVQRPTGLAGQLGHGCSSRRQSPISAGSRKSLKLPLTIVIA